MLNTGDHESFYVGNMLSGGSRPFVMIGRIIGSIGFMDFRHGFCINVLFSVARPGDF